MKFRIQKEISQVRDLILAYLKDEGRPDTDDHRADNEDHVQLNSITCFPFTSLGLIKHQIELQKRFDHTVIDFISTATTVGLRSFRILVGVFTLGILIYFWTSLTSERLLIGQISMLILTLGGILLLYMTFLKSDAQRRYAIHLVRYLSSYAEIEVMSPLQHGARTTQGKALSMLLLLGSFGSLVYLARSVTILLVPSALVAIIILVYGLRPGFRNHYQWTHCRLEVTSRWLRWVFQTWIVVTILVVVHIAMFCPFEPGLIGNASKQEVSNALNNVFQHPFPLEAKPTILEDNIEIVNAIFYGQRHTYQLPSFQLNSDYFAKGPRSWSLPMLVLPIVILIMSMWNFWKTSSWYNSLKLYSSEYHSKNVNQHPIPSLTSNSHRSIILLSWTTWFSFLFSAVFMALFSLSLLSWMILSTPTMFPQVPHILAWFRAVPMSIGHYSASNSQMYQFIWDSSLVALTSPFIYILFVQVTQSMSRVFRCRPIMCSKSSEQYRSLHTLLSEYCNRLDLETPDLCLYDDTNIIMASEYSIIRRSNRLLVSTSTLSALNNNELVAVLAHELYHLKHDTKRIAWLTVLSRIALCPCPLLILTLDTSQIEYNADKHALDLGTHPTDLENAIRKLESLKRLNLSTPTSHKKTSRSYTNKSLRRLRAWIRKAFWIDPCATYFYPPIDDRIRNIQARSQ